jgi:hypothetical protein
MSRLFFPRATFRLLALLGVALLWAGCATTDQGQASESTALGISPNRVLGELVWMNPDRTAGILLLDESRPLTGIPYVITHDGNFNITGVWLVTPQQRGLSIGLQLVGGRPELAEEILLPGPEIRSLVEARFPFLSER